ncbi:MAG: hypothetical protein ACRENH_13175, partial [Gemmatimonadaceae bacterium]
RPAFIDYMLATPADSLTIEIVDASARLARRVTSNQRGRGLHRVYWDGRYSGATVFPGIILEGGDPRRGPLAPPGRYEARLTSWAGGRGVSRNRTLEVRKDPRAPSVSDADLHAQFKLALAIRNATTKANEAVIAIRQLTDQLTDRARRASDGADGTKAIAPLALALVDSLRAVEGELYQVKNQSSKDKIAFPIKLNDRLTGLRSNLERGDGAPPAAYYRVYNELSAELNAQLRKLRTLLERDLAALNKRLSEARLATVVAGT